jgi:predicted MPP superfamily phosphohydrolase
VVIAIAVTAAIFFFLSMFLGDRLPINVTSIMYKTGSTWFFILLELIVFFLLMDLLRLLPFLRISGLLYNSWAGFAGTVVLIGGMMVYGNINYFTPKRTEITVKMPINSYFTPQLSSIKAVFMSDLHIGYNISADEIAKWVSLVNKENPDIILFGGDIIDNSTRPLFADSSIAPLFRSLKARYGIYGVLGNHEYISQRGRTIKNSTDPTYREIQEAAATAESELSNTGLPEVERFYREAGITLLRDTTINIAGYLLITGRDDYSNPQRNSLEALLAVIPDTVRRTLPLVLLDHQPRNFNETAANGFTLQLSGHTHAGQLIPVSWITRLMYENNYGLLEKAATTFYVTSGLGIWGGKFRIGTKSEYVIVNLDLSPL